MLKFSKEKVVGKALIEVEITENDISTIVITGFEGGIGYWSIIDNVGEEWDEKPKDEPTATWGTKLLLEGKSIRLIDVDDENEVWLLTLDKIIEGYRLNSIHRPFDSDLENGDVTTADCIIQYGLFGKLVYG